METGVVRKHQWSQVEFPINRRIVTKAGQVFGNCFVCHFSLAVALRMMRRRREVIGAQPFEQFVRKVSTKFLSLVGDDVELSPKTTVPFVENGICDGVGFLIGQGHEFNIFC
jgi:hypothetical protein